MRKELIARSARALLGALCGYIWGWVWGWSILDPNTDVWALGSLVGLPAASLPARANDVAASGAVVAGAVAVAAAFLDPGGRAALLNRGAPRV